MNLSMRLGAAAEGVHVVLLGEDRIDKKGNARNKIALYNGVVGGGCRDEGLKVVVVSQREKMDCESGGGVISSGSKR